MSPPNGVPSIEGWLVRAVGLLFFFNLLTFRLLSGLSVLCVFSDHIFYSVQTACERLSYSQ